ncbi:MAG: cupin domain-containing protein [Clostridia bacterium]|nr:cupin domain-containing protein [Clostridia bacterium]
MVIRTEDCKIEQRPQMRGGDGTVQITHFVGKEALLGKGRLFARITLAPGCSIGEHVHEGDSELFVVERGCPTYDDGGVSVEAKPGDVLICPPETAHAIKNNTAETVDLIALIVYA